MDTIGADTRDILALRQRHPDEPDSGLPDRRYGTAMIASGAGVIACTVLVVAMIPESAVDVMRPVVALTVAVALLAVGAAGVIAGLNEKLFQYNRTLMRSCLASQHAHDELVRQHVAEVTPHLDRLPHVEAAIDRIADYLPEDQQLQHWRGYAAATHDHDSRDEQKLRDRRRLDIITRNHPRPT